MAPCQTRQLTLIERCTPLRPKTISASSLANAQDCLSKFAAVNLEFIPEVGKKEPAAMGSVIHHVLQWFVYYVWIKKTHSWDDMDLFMRLYEEGWVLHFKTCDTRSKWYDEGLELALSWHERTDLSEVEVLSVEEKRRTPVPSAKYDRTKSAEQNWEENNAAIVPLSYIWDRADWYVHPITGLTHVRIVDYKSQYLNLTQSQLVAKLQCQIYAMVAMIYFKDRQPDVIEVELDMLRYGPVNAKFSTTQCVKTWRDLRNELQRILDTSISQAKRMRTLGPGCRYCPIAPTCDKLKANIDGGGLMSLDLEQTVQLRADLEAQMKTSKVLIEQADLMIAAEAIELDMLEFTVGQWEIELKSTGRSNIPQDQAQIIMGTEIYANYAPLTMAKYKQLMKSDTILTEDQKIQLSMIVEKTFSDPKVRVTARDGE